MSSHVLTAVVHDLTTRETRGVDKYGTTLDRTDLSPTQRLQHFYEEMLDGAMYAKSLLMQLEEQGIELHDPRALAARERESCLSVGTQVWRATPVEDVKPGDEIMRPTGEPVLVRDVVIEPGAGVDPGTIRIGDIPVPEGGPFALTHEKKPLLVADAPHNWTPITLGEAQRLTHNPSWVVRERGPATA